MRTPSPTFRDALKAHQHWLETLKPEWRRRLAQSTLARWIDHPECESIWMTVRSLLKIKPSPERFIADIIAIRLDAEALAKTKKWDPKAEMLACTEQLLHRGKHSELPERFADFATVLPTFEGARERVRRVGLLSRKATARMHFMRTLSAGFVQWSKDKRPHHDTVRLLTDIAFDYETTIDAVRDARKPRARR
jgi:hypothetical protein